MQCINGFGETVNFVLKFLLSPPERPHDFLKFRSHRRENLSVASLSIKLVLVSLIRITIYQHNLWDNLISNSFQDPRHHILVVSRLLIEV